MPIREATVDVNEPSNGPGGRAETEFENDLETGGESPAAGADPDHNRDPASGVNGAASGSGDGAPVVRGSRWIDYDTHELLEMIGNLEDERRWARLREGVLWAVLIHILVLFALFMIPRYVLKMRPVIQTDNLRDQKEFTYLGEGWGPFFNHSSGGSIGPGLRRGDIRRDWSLLKLPNFYRTTSWMVQTVPACSA